MVRMLLDTDPDARLTAPITTKKSRLAAVKRLVALCCNSCALMPQHGDDVSFGEFPPDSMEQVHCLVGICWIELVCELPPQNGIQRVLGDGVGEVGAADDGPVTQQS